MHPEKITFWKSPNIYQNTNSKVQQIYSIIYEIPKNESKWKHHMRENNLFVGLMEILLPVPLEIFHDSLWKR